MWTVLEYHHLQYAFREMRKEELQFTERWDKAKTKEFRRQCVYSVLATDLSEVFSIIFDSHHDALLRNTLCDQNVATISKIKQLKNLGESDLMWVFKAIIKMSDLSHVTKPLEQHQTWTNRITSEFYKQGGLY